MKDHLFVDEAQSSQDKYRITWSLDNGDDVGSSLGPYYTIEDLGKCKPDDRVHVLACLEAGKSAGVDHDYNGYYWETVKLARIALQMVKLALKNDGGAPWPQWAMEAVSHGWKAPKGWKP